MSKRQSDRAARPVRARVDRRPWQPMSITPLGRVSDLVQGGGGKLSLVGGDPGESRKEIGTEP